MSDQKDPIAGKRDVTSLLMKEIVPTLKKRQRKGIETYGRSLQTWNGRDVHRDLTEELMDALQYAVQSREERKDIERVLGCVFRCVNMALKRVPPLSLSMEGMTEGEAKIYTDTVAPLHGGLLFIRDFLEDNLPNELVASWMKEMGSKENE